MTFHHRVKPHHHLAIWILVALLVVIAGLVYSTTSLDKALADNGPSEKTMKFFGFNEAEEGRDWVMPEACKMQAQQDQMQQLSTEMQSVSSQMNSLSQQSQDPNLTYEQRQANQQKIEQLQQKLSSLQAEMEQLSKTFQAGPSDECKIAMVNQAVSMMSEMLTKMNNRFPSTLAKVETVVAKVEKAIPTLQAAGVSATDIQKMEADVASIKVQLGVLRSFFDKMKTSMQNFINEAKANPVAVFARMQNGSLGMDDASANQAATAADSMVAAFEDIVSVLDKVQAEEP